MHALPVPPLPTASLEAGNQSTVSTGKGNIVHMLLLPLNLHRIVVWADKTTADLGIL